jgi:hypothetical protein
MRRAVLLMLAVLVACGGNVVVDGSNDATTANGGTTSGSMSSSGSTSSSGSAVCACGCGKCASDCTAADVPSAQPDLCDGAKPGPNCRDCLRFDAGCGLSPELVDALEAGACP